MSPLRNQRWHRVRKRPIVVEARGPIETPERIVTLEGVLVAEVGDYIVRGIQGEEYPVKPDIFTETYETLGEIRS